MPTSAELGRPGADVEKITCASRPTTVGRHQSRERAPVCWSVAFAKFTAVRCVGDDMEYDVATRDRRYAKVHDFRISDKRFLRVFSSYDIDLI